LGKATWDRRNLELLRDIMVERDYGQLKDLFSDRLRWGHWCRKCEHVYV